jgi:hypothetical protein
MTRFPFILFESRFNDGSDRAFPRVKDCIYLIFGGVSFSLISDPLFPFMSKVLAIES